MTGTAVGVAETSVGVGDGCGTVAVDTMTGVAEGEGVVGEAVDVGTIRGWGAHAPKKQSKARMIFQGARRMRPMLP